jgi:hypothetical protein
MLFDDAGSDSSDSEDEEAVEAMEAVEAVDSSDSEDEDKTYCLCKGVADVSNSPMINCTDCNRKCLKMGRVRGTFQWRCSGYAKLAIQ